MTKRAKGLVEALTSVRPGVQELLVRHFVQDGHGLSQGLSITVRPALNFTALTGEIEPGDQVEVNTSAIDLDLGTGGYDIVISLLNRTPESSTPPGHIIKMRYSPVQTPVLAVEAQESPYHEAIKAFTSLDEIPVVCCELHSQVPATCAALHWGLKQCGKQARIVYIMTDGASLPLALSKLVSAMKERGLIEGTVTAGQAFGGDVEAVNIYSALAAARIVMRADAIVTGQGPGNVGTGTPLGFSGVDQGQTVNAVASLGGTPVFVPRISFSDKRSRHVGLSHHSITNLTRIIHVPTLVPIPRLPRMQLSRLYTIMAEHGITKTHEAITVDADKGLKALEETGVTVTTMGRGLTQERAFFLAAAAAGLLAAQIVENNRDRARSSEEQATSNQE